MKYRNAGDILPDKLLKELQQYAQGEVLYVPSDKVRKKWGTRSGAKIFYEQRNEEIRRKYFNLKVSLEELCEEYSLSDETVKKILYK